MNSKELFDILAGVAFIAFGAFFGVIANRLIAVREKSAWKSAYYLLGILLIVFALILLVVKFRVISELGWFAVIFSIVSGSLIVFATRKLLDVSDVYSIAKLNPIINKFTRLADRTEIKLFGGDLNFFGNSIL